MFSVITLIHDQAENLPIVLRAYSEQSIQPSQYIFVLDRCTDQSENILKNFLPISEVIILKNEKGSDFLAGYCRDLALNETGGNVLFLDGDCVPTVNVFEEILKSLDSTEPTISIVKRLNEKENHDGFYPDTRETSPWYKEWVFKEHKNIIEHKELARVRMLTWSCSLGLNRAAISVIKEINKEIGLGRRLFPSSFDGKWGGEDDHIGHVAMFTDMKIIAISPEHYVTHIWHKPRTNAAYEITSSELYNKIKKYANDNKLPGTHYANINMNNNISEYMQKNYNIPKIFNVLVTTDDEPLDDEP